MKILFVIDPCDLWKGMLEHRYINFHKIARGLCRRHEVIFCMPSSVSNFPNYEPLRECEYVLLNPLDLNLEWYGQYHVGVLTQNLSESQQSIAKTYFDTMHDLGRKRNVDLVITNSPWPGIRNAFKDAVVLNYELGIFNRPPLPIFHQFDPLGMYAKSLIYNLPNLGLRLESEKTLTCLANELNAHHSLEVKNIKGIFYPLQSEANWPIRLEMLDRNAAGLIYNLRRQYPDHPIYISQKSNYPISSQLQAEIQRIPNIIQIKQISDSAIIIPWFEKIFSINSSLGLQSVFWGKELLTPPNTSLSPWSTLKDLERKKLLLGGLLDTFWVREEIINDESEIDTRFKMIFELSKYIVAKM